MSGSNNQTAFYDRQSLCGVKQLIMWPRLQSQGILYSSLQRNSHRKDHIVFVCGGCTCTDLCQFSLLTVNVFVCRLYSRRVVYGLPAVSGRERGRTAGLCHGGPGSPTRGHHHECLKKKALLWLVVDRLRTKETLFLALILFWPVLQLLRTSNNKNIIYFR